MTEPRSALCGLLLLACAEAWAQAAPQPSAAASAAERAQKESDRTMYWIRVLADKPAPVKVAPTPKPVAAVAAPAAKPATEARDKVKLAAAPTPGATATTANAANGAPATVARPSNSAQVPGADVPEPSALSSHSADNAAAAGAALPLPEAAPTPAEEPDPGLIQIKSVPPAFPVNVVQRIHRGNVEVKFQVDAGGTVVDATVVESSYPRLNDSALDAVKQWRFKPTPKPHTALVNLMFDIDKEK